MKLNEVVNTSQFLTDRNEIENWLKQNHSYIEKYVIRDDNTVDADDVFLPANFCRLLPVQFGTVKNGFLCDNVGLRSLRGAPKTVGNFSCRKNLITNFEHGPTTVRGSYSASNNTKLESLKGCPEEIPFNFSVQACKLLKSLEYSPKKIGGMFTASECSLTTLVGMAESVEGAIFLEGNKITSLEGLPKSINALLSCPNNLIETLDYLPSNISHIIDLRRNLITSLKGINDVIKTIDKLDAGLKIDLNDITSGGLGLLLINNVTNMFNDKTKKPFKIIQKYIGKPDKMFVCQEELIEAGFEEYAEL